MNIRLKGCGRCGGDLFPDRTDREGRTLVCLQCGLEEPLVFSRQLAAAAAPVVTAAEAVTAAAR